MTKNKLSGLGDIGVNQLYRKDTYKERTPPYKFDAENATTSPYSQQIPSSATPRMTERQKDILMDGKKLKPIIREDGSLSWIEETKEVKEANQSVPIRFSQNELAVIDKVRKSAEKLGIKAYLAGGLLRDKMLGIESQDLDFVTNKGSDALAKELARTYNLPEPIKMDRSGATMVHLDDQPIDLIDATKVFRPLKQDESLEVGEEGEMSIFLDDAFRRDLTINSLMYDIHSGKLLDPTGRGVEDVQNRVIRTIIDPNLKYRFHAPDMLRALRFFSTKPDFKLAPDMLKAMKTNAPKLLPRSSGGDISERRIERELRKIIKDPVSWSKFKQVASALNLGEIIGKQIQSVEDDNKGNIDYGFEKGAYTQIGMPDNAGETSGLRREDNLSLPYRGIHNNYNGADFLLQKEQIRKRKERLKKLKKLKEFSKRRRK